MQRLKGIDDLEELTSITNCERRKTLRQVLQSKQCLRIIEAHSPISAMIAEKTRVMVNDDCLAYDGFWCSSLTDSLLQAKPDIEILDVNFRLKNIHNIFDVTTKPMIYDADTGGKIEHLIHDVRALERAGVSMIVIEDKTGLKKNSLLGNDVEQKQDDIESFCEKISMAKKSQNTQEFMVAARIESLILDKGLEDALIRADAYVNAGADAVLIHSRKRSGDEIMEFASRFRAIHPTVPLMCVPTSYSHLHYQELKDMGFNIIIYANHMMRSAISSMESVAKSILSEGCSEHIERDCISVKQALAFIPGTI
ncbi:Cytidylyltransferase domain [Pseudomonas sp. R4-39-08]|uniref:phosphoenolpyruvate mutase n=1 Tax=Pseudomonas sp. R4-39-08 TaxID=1173288 RepID=UPI000F55F2F5|nr:phosphoenolpyruvate mutase [Pseudomonas sp. R4-39-08]AZF38324.1 Cytidylyltransferase domain [Pseudomonas sp. R4-39-08]